MSFSRLKQDAKTIIKQSKPNVILVALVFIAAVTLLNYLANNVLTLKIREQDVNNVMILMEEGRYEYALTQYEKMMPSPSANLISVVIGLLQEVLSTGFIIFLMHTVRKTGEACFANLLDGFAVILKLLLLLLLEAVFVFLWSMLLVIPGIIAAYRYSQALYIMLDNPELSALDCIRKSKELMTGHKWERFVLDLSFLGWAILSLVPLVRIWTEPYMETTKLLYYQQLAGIPYTTEIKEEL